MKFKELRLKTGKNQTQLSNEIGIPRINYNKYELEQVEPDIKTLIKIADYYQISLDYLCDRPFNNGIGYIPEEKKEVVKLILQLNETNTLKLFGYVSGLLANQN